MKTLWTGFTLLLWQFSVAQFLESEILYECPTQGYSVIAAEDFDGDGEKDWVLRTEFGSLSVAWGGLANQLADRFEFDSSYQFKKVQAIDLDYDGDLDIIGKILNTDVLIWRENLGDRNFVTNVIDTGSNYWGYADFGNDGIGELIYTIGNEIWMANLQPNNVLVNPVYISNFANTSTEATVLDIDNDGDLDIMSGTDLLLRQVENGFEANLAYCAIIGSDDNICFEDVDQDGLIDVVGGVNSIRWAPNQGNASFSNPIDILSSSYINSLLFFDLDGDGLRDLIYSENVSKLSVAARLDATSFAAPNVVSAIAPETMLLTDLSESGISEILMSCPQNELIASLSSNSEDTAEPEYLIGPSFNQIDDVVMLDVNEDGLQDILLCSRQFNQIGLLLQQMDGSFAFEEDFSDELWLVQQIAVGNVRDNGKKQIIYNKGYQLYMADIDPVLLSIGESELILDEIPAVSPIDDQMYQIAIADADQDGLNDILFSIGNNQGPIWLRQSEDGQIDYEGQINFEEGQLFSLFDFFLCDYSREGAQDIGWINNFSLGIYQQPEDSFYALNEFLPIPLSPATLFLSNLSVVDANGDGRDDFVYQLNGGTTALAITYSGETEAGSILMPLDFGTRTACLLDQNQDAYPDIVALNVQVGEQSLMQLFHGAADSSFTLVQEQNVPLAEASPMKSMERDVDNDGDQDLLFWSAFQDQLLLLRNQQVTTVDLAPLDRNTEAPQLQFISGTSQLNISGMTIGAPYQLRIYDIQGRSVYESELRSVSQNMEVQLPVLRHGQYLIQLRGQGTKVSKVAIW